MRIAAFAFLVAGGVLLGQEADSNEPIINFGISAPMKGVINGWTEGVTIKLDGATEVQNGPVGARALKFIDGSKASFNLGPYASRLRNTADLSFSIFLRVDSEPGKDVDTGLGVRLNGWNFSVGNGAISVQGKKTLEKGKWYQIAFTYSTTTNVAKIYVDGMLDNVMMNVKLSALKLPYSDFGGFDGAVASMKVWDRALGDKELLSISTDQQGLTSVVKRIENLQKHVRAKEMIPYLENVKKEINRVKNKKEQPIQVLEDIQYTAITALQLLDGEVFLRETGLVKAPFSLMQVGATAAFLRRPDRFPEDAVFTDKLCAAAAKGEFEPLSFVIYPFRKMDKVEITVSDFVCKEKSATLPSAKILDRKLVKHWFQASWNGVYNNADQILVPDLLVNDPDLVKVDVLNGKNYLRVGGKYVCVNEMQNTGVFNYCKEDVRDADTLQPVKMEEGKGTQFWFTFKVPSDAKPGLYTAKATVTEGGNAIANFTIQLRVYPFELPAPKTCYDITRDYIVAVAGDADLSRYVKMSGSASDGEKLFRRELQSLKEHNVNKPTVPYCADAAVFAKDLKIRKEMGFDLTDVFVAAFDGEGTLLTEFPTEDRQNADFGVFRKNTAAASASFAEIAGHKNFYFYGFETAVPVSVDKYRNEILKNSGRTMTGGWGNDVYYLPSRELMHAHSGSPDDYLAEKWHALRGRIISCGCYFAGPKNPDYIRRNLGMNLYRATYDGFMLYAYPSSENCWNERAGQGLYRNPIFAYPTANGQISTIAYEGLREGIDDVRYVTLLRQLTQHSFDIKNWDAIFAGKKGVAVFELLPTSKMNLDLMRLEVADHIVTIYKRLGKEVE